MISADKADALAQAVIGLRFSWYRMALRKESLLYVDSFVC